MYGQQHPTIFQRSSSDFLTYLLTSPDVMPSPLNFPLIPVDSVSDAIHSSGSSSSGSYSCCTQKPSFVRSFSSHSLPKNELHCRIDSSHSGPVRRVLSAGDLHGGQRRAAESPSSNESNANAIIEGMCRAWPYSPEEKKQRIQRYRTKRNLRNFNKKIKYACRKTLADSRPRIRGRFIRNAEIEKNPQVEWNQINGEEEEEEMNWIGFLDIHS